MYNTDSSDDLFSKQERALGEAPCQNCGKMVTIMLPFIGCIFCGDCITSDSGWNDGSEDFYEPRRTKEELRQQYWPFFEKPIIRRIDNVNP